MTTSLAKILLATDGSEASEFAARAAADLSNRTADGSVLVVPSEMTSARRSRVGARG